MAKYSLGLDFGTNSVRALIADIRTGEEVASAVSPYAHGDSGIVTDSRQPDLARQHPSDYLDGMRECVPAAVEKASGRVDFSKSDILAIGVDATGSTPLPVDGNNCALAMSQDFAGEPGAMAWLWKDHTSHAEAEEITRLAKEIRPGYLAKCGGTYSSEWYWAKVLHAARVAPKVVEAAANWVELTDWIPAILTGQTNPAAIRRGICTAGHKGLFHDSWGGYPDEEFLEKLDPALARLRRQLPDKAYTIADQAGALTANWAREFGLNEGIPVAVGALDAHMGAVGSGIQPGVMVKIAGTSSCDMIVAPLAAELPDIPGLCGIVPESILPEMYGLEAGQSAFGDIYNWFVQVIQPGGPEAGSHGELTAACAGLKPGESGLLGLDWHNGNRTVLVDQRLSGLLAGMNLQTAPAEIYRALIESTAFGARRIMERFEEYGVRVERVIACGGIAVKNPLVMQILADVSNRPIEVSSSDQTCALGAAMAGAVVAGHDAGGHPSFAEAARAMTSTRPESYRPNPEAVTVYEELYGLYCQLHDSFGTKEYSGNLFGVMKKLLEIRDSVRSS